MFKIIGTYGIEDNLINKDYEYIRKSRINRYNELKKFVNSLTQEQIDSNVFFKSVTLLMETSIIDCKLIIEKLQKEISDLELSDENKKIEIKINIPEERLNIFPKSIRDQVGIPYYKPQDYKISYINVLPTERKYVYEDYNEYVRKIKIIAEDIYKLQLWNLLSVYPYQINNYYFSIFNNDLEYKFSTRFFVKKVRKESIENTNTIYEVNNKTKEIISKVIGLPFEKIINMNPDDLEKHIEQQLHYDLSEQIDEENIIKIKQIDKELSKVTNKEKVKKLYVEM